MKIDHFNISAPFDLLEEVRDFYCAVFGLCVGFKPTSMRRGFWLYEADTAIIHLSESNRHFANERPGYLDHVAFKMTGLAGLQEKLDRLGVTYTSNYIDELDITQLFFADPAGLKLEANFSNERFENL